MVGAITNSQIIKLSIPQATDRKPITLIVEAPVDVAIAVVQVAEPGIVGIVLSRTPPVTGVPNGAECTIAEAEATRKPCEAAAIGGIGIGGNPMGCACFFHLAACHCLAAQIIG